MRSIRQLKNLKIRRPLALIEYVMKCSKLFTLILKSRAFPTLWSDGIITALHKSGNKDDPSNYRGTCICISSCLGKLFCSILNNRLLNFSQKHNIIHHSQIGFLPGHHTSDHIFALKTLIDKHVTQIMHPRVNYIHVLLILKKLLIQFGIKVYFTNY